MESEVLKRLNEDLRPVVFSKPSKAVFATPTPVLLEDASAVMVAVAMLEVLVVCKTVTFVGNCQSNIHVNGMNQAFPEDDCSETRTVLLTGCQWFCCCGLY